MRKKSLKRGIQGAALFLLAAMLTAGCGEKEEESNMASEETSKEIVEVQEETIVSETEAETVAESVSETPTPSPSPSAEELYREMVELSQKYVGNNYRIKKVIEKLRNGEELYVAVLGGSVTEGAGATTNDRGYAYLFAEELGKTYGTDPEKQIHYVNAGLSGTSSLLGLMRYQQDVVKPLGQDPDLLIIEFAVNDWQEPTNARAYECLVYEALSAKEDCAVIELCSVAKTAWNTQESHLTVAKHYQVPLVSLKAAVFTPKEETRIPASTYFMDDYHPKQYGHQLTTDCLMKLFEQADAAPEDAPAPIPEEAVKGRDFTGLVLVDSENQVKGLKTGSFDATDEKVVQEFFTKSASFPNNFYHSAGSGNDPLTLKVKCKKILLNYKTSTDASFGKADIYVDGNLVTTVDGHSGGAWNNCNILLVLDAEEAAEHTLDIQMAQDSADKAFTVLAISYCE